MSSGYDGDDELFARVWAQRDAAERPAPPDPRRERPQERPQELLDPELARVLDVASALRTAGRAAQGPDPDASARMRAAVMAEIGGGTADGATRERTRVLRSPDPGPAGGRGAGRAGATTRRETRESRGGTRPADRRPAARATSRRSGARLLSSFVTGACAVMLLGALTVLLSRGALPGEMLYGIKRASESAEIGLTSGQEAKGLKHLDFASTRLEEVSDLIERQAATAAGAGPVAAGIGPDEAALVLDNLRAFDEQARTGSRLILPLAAQPTGPSPAELGEWARSQSARLDTLSPSLDGDGRTAAAGSQQMLQRIDQRATAFGGSERCSTGDAADDLGPLPTGDCDAGSASDDTQTTTTAIPESTTTSTTSSTTTSSTSSTTSSRNETSSRDDDSDDSGSSSGSREQQTSTPDPVQVPLPVPLLPQVDVPPLLPGLPGLSLG
ncbi:DUF5667 domain-containing protein [Actinomycetospora callitridis]|uniref:DUF5667 domain-containing protein n=1 Tax=Actinomycetospora callitridis TaxID=913944 RepID=UPI002366B9ED|nr:DUF5667 domain-containing protein [Actinomycetospora callitridis]MDD7918088.1 DUF5667 domain-containing protein [Actinomycetospora callitridis]